MDQERCCIGAGQTLHVHSRWTTVRHFPACGASFIIIIIIIIIIIYLRHLELRLLQHDIL